MDEWKCPICPEPSVVFGSSLFLFRHIRESHLPRPLPRLHHASLSRGPGGSTGNAGPDMQRGSQKGPRKKNMKQAD
eukprot:1011678-Pyramimonas_sp.AAC.1